MVSLSLQFTCIVAIKQTDKNKRRKKVIVLIIFGCAEAFFKMLIEISNEGKSMDKLPWHTKIMMIKYHHPCDMPFINMSIYFI